MTPALRDEIRDALVACSPEKGLAEEQEPEERLPFFLPTAPFRNALAPDIYLVLGERGAGKTMLFRVLSDEGPGVFDGPALGASASVGFGRRRGDYSVPTVEDIARALAEADETRLRVFWLGLLGRRLNAELSGISQELRAALAGPADTDSWFPVVTARIGELSAALDAFDGRLAERAEWRFVLYDDLDLVVSTWQGLFAPLRGLFALWLERCRQWRRLRPKIFLRIDLFRSELLAFPDGAKFFAAHKVDLLWTPTQLYALLVKRMINQDRSAEYRAWLAGTLESHLEFVDLPQLGRTPIRGDGFAPPLMEALVGKYMGANPRKGLSHEWVSNHLADANGQRSPRSWVRMFAFAAEEARRLGDTDRPLTPACFSAAEVKVSGLRLQELADEDPWILALKDELQGASVPMELEELLDRLGRAHFPSGSRSPPWRGGFLVAHLRARGLLEQRPDGRINVPEIYRHGLGLLRRGGVRRQADGDLL